MSVPQPAMPEPSSGGETQDPMGKAVVSAWEKGSRLSQRLPSILVEPGEVGAVESGELRWPPEGTQRTSPQSQAAAAPSPSRARAPVKFPDDAGSPCASSKDQVATAQE
ncbi:LBH domain-containing protein 2 [Tamandua tetradactyla]|uniref:LBH domain-containing protein 2 n=1 Tax=Tamandua tetradactyla TaxID=48850 RepID=UPI0040546D49